MIDARLSLALEGGGLVLPKEGRVAVVHPGGEASLSALPKDRIEIIEGFRPAYDSWCARGYGCAVGMEGRYAAAVVCLPRAKSEARALIASAVSRTDGLIIVDGQKTDGVDSIFKDMRKRANLGGPIAKAHGKLFWADRPDPDAFQDWEAGPALTPGGFWTAPGVFSADAVDPASALLASALPDDIGKRVADLGAGWGYLSAHVLTRPKVEEIHLVEADHMALECARHNVTDPRASFHWDNAIDWAQATRMDTVVMNPPFHTSRAADPALGQAFVQSAARILQPQGHLWMVANRHLPYEATLQNCFAQVTETGADKRFKLFHASRPLRKRT